MNKELDDIAYKLYEEEHKNRPILVHYDWFIKSNLTYFKKYYIKAKAKLRKEKLKKLNLL